MCKGKRLMKALSKQVERERSVLLEWSDTESNGEVK